MAKLTWYIDTTSNSFVGGLNTTKVVDPFTLPLVYPDTPTIKIYLFEKLQTLDPNTFPFDIISTEGLQLFLEITDGLVDEDRTVYTQQIIWDPDANSQYFTANLALNTPAIKALVKASAPNQADAYLKIAYIQDGLQTDVIFRPIKIGIGVGTTTLVVPPGQTALSLQVAMAMFFPIKPVPGLALELASPNGKIKGRRIVDYPDGSSAPDDYDVN
jgi:hypothetical protein